MADEVTIPDPNKPTPPLDKTPKFEPSRTFDLASPVKNGSEMLSSITLRTPNGLDLFEVGGLPTTTMWTDDGMRLKMDTAMFQKWLVRLSDKSMPIFYQVPARDLRAMYEWLNIQLSAGGN